MFTFPLAIYGAFLIIFVTPEKMRSARGPLLNLHFFTFLLDAIVDFLITPYIYLPTSAVTLCGVLYETFGLPFKPLCYVGQLSLYLMGMSMVRLFQTRHSMITTIQYRMTNNITLIIYYTCMYIFGIFIMIAYFFDDTDTTQAKLHFLTVYPCPPLDYFEDDTLVITTNISLALFCMSTASCTIVSHTLYFGMVGAYSLLRVPSRTLSTKTKQLQLTFLYTLSIQVVIPFSALVVPTTMFGFMLLVSVYSQKVNNVIMVTISLHGLLSNISLIFIHQPYREFTKNLMFGNNLKTKKSSVSVIVVSNTQIPRA